MTSRIINDTDERIVIEPGESLDGKILKDQNKTTVAKLIKYRIVEIDNKEDNDSCRLLKHCGRCGEFNGKNADECKACKKDLTETEPIKMSQ